MSAELDVAIVDRFADLAILGDQRGAASLALNLVGSGVPVERVVLDMLAPVQRGIGERWERNDASVADEHVVTAVTFAALEAIAATGVPAGRSGAVVMACAEGDWHSLPTRMMAELLRSRDWPVVFLGPSTPADHLAGFIDARRPRALLVGCSLPLHFAGAARLADVARVLGVPVVFGGRAMTAHRAAKLGADAVATSVDEAAAVLEQSLRSSIAIEALNPEALHLDGMADEVAAQAMAALEVSLPAVGAFDPVRRQRTLDDLAYLTRFAAAAVLVDDRSVWTDNIAWQTRVVTGRGVPRHALLAGITALIGPVAALCQPAADLLADELPAGRP